MEEEVLEEKQKVVDIQPITKGKRVLVFLADFFLMFILTFVFFNALVMPLSNIMTLSTTRSEESNAAAEVQYGILYNQKVLFHENASDIYYYNANVEYTMNCFLSYYKCISTIRIFIK